MTINHSFDARLSFDKADRLRRALRVAGISVNDMAEYLEVSRNTVTSWINGRNQPRRRDLAAFALRTGFPIAWLETGEAPHDGGAPDGLPSSEPNQDSECTPWDLNPEPTDSEADISFWRPLLDELVAA